MMHTGQVRDWMTPNPITAPPSTSLPDALKLMAEQNIRRLPIVERGKLVGVVTRGDLRNAQPTPATSLSSFELHYLADRITLDQMMTRDPITVTDTATIQAAARLMLAHKISGLPVMKQGHLVGLITESDIFRLVVQTWEEPSAPMAAGH